MFEGNAWIRYLDNVNYRVYEKVTKQTLGSALKRNLDSQTFPWSWLLIRRAEKVNTGRVRQEENKFTITFQVNAARQWCGVWKGNAGRVYLLPSQKKKKDGGCVLTFFTQDAAERSEAADEVRRAICCCSLRCLNIIFDITQQCRWITSEAGPSKPWNGYLYVVVFISWLTNVF